MPVAAVGAREWITTVSRSPELKLAVAVSADLSRFEIDDRSRGNHHDLHGLNSITNSRARTIDTSKIGIPPWSPTPAAQARTQGRSAIEFVER